MMAPSQHLPSRIWSAIFVKNTVSSPQNTPDKKSRRQSPAATPSEHEFKLSPTFPPHPRSSQLLHVYSCTPDTESETSGGERRSSHQLQLRNKTKNPKKYTPLYGQNMKFESDPRRPDLSTPMAGGFGRDILKDRLSNASAGPTSQDGDSVRLGLGGGNGDTSSHFPLPPAGYFPVVFTLQKPVSAQMGLSLIAAEEEGVQGYFKIRRLLDAGAGKRDGRIKEGDILAMVNGQHLINWEQIKVINLLRRPIDQVSIVLLRQKNPKPPVHLNQNLNTQQNQSPISPSPLGNLSVTQNIPQSPKLPRRNNRSNGTPKFPSEIRRDDPKTTDILPDVLRGVAVDSDDNDITHRPSRMSSRAMTKPLESERNNTSVEPLTRNDTGGRTGNGNNEHTLSDEDTEDEQEHNDVVASLIHKYDPRNPFPVTVSPTSITVGASIAPGVKSGKSQPETTPPDEKQKNRQMAPQVDVPQNQNSSQNGGNSAHVVIQTLELSDVENSDTNLSQFDINGKETPVDNDGLPSIPHPFTSQGPPSIPNNHRPPSLTQELKATQIAESKLHMASSVIMTPDIDQFLAKTKPKAQTKNTAIQTAPLSQPRRNVYPPGYFHTMEAPNADPTIWDPIASSPEDENEYNFAPQKYFVPQPRTYMSPAVGSRSGLSTSSPIMAKLDNLSNQLDKLLNPAKVDEDNFKRPGRPFSASDLLLEEPELSPISSLQANTVPERCKSIDNLSAIKPGSEDGSVSLTFKTPFLAKSSDSKSTSDLQQFNQMPPSPFKSNPKTEKRLKPLLDLPPANYKDVKRPKSRRKTKHEDEDDDLATERFLRNVHNLSAEFEVDPRTPLTESFRFPKNNLTSDTLNDASPSSRNASEDNQGGVSPVQRENPKAENIRNATTPNEEPETNYISDLLENSDLALDDLSRNSSISHHSQDHEDPRDSGDDFDPEERQPEDIDEISVNPASPLENPTETLTENLPIVPPVNFAMQMGETFEPEEAISFYNIMPKTSIAASAQQLYPENEFVTFRKRARKFSGESNHSSLHSNHTFEVDYPIMDKPQLQHVNFHRPHIRGKFKPRFDQNEAVNFIAEDEVEFQMLKESLKPPDKKHLFLNRERPRETKKSSSDKMEEFCRAKRKPATTPFKDIDLLLNSEATTRTQKPTTSKVETKPPKPKSDPIEEEKGSYNTIGIPPLPQGLTDRRSSDRDSTLKRNKRISPRLQKGRGFSVPLNHGPVSNTAGNTLDSVSFTIPLDENDYQHDISNASTPTILRNSFEDLNQQSMMKKRNEPEDSEKDTTNDPWPFKKSGNVEKLEKPAATKEFPEKPKDLTEKLSNPEPVGIIPTLSEPPSMVNLISYDDWKKSLLQELQPGDRIKRPVSVRQSKSSSSTNRKKNEDKKTKQTPQKYNLESRSPESSKKPEPLGKASAVVLKSRQTPMTNKAPQPTPKTKYFTNSMKNPSKQAADRIISPSKSPGRAASSTSKVTQKKGSADPEAADTVAKPTLKEEREPQRLSLSAQKSNDSSSPIKEKMGFNVALDNFMKPSTTHPSAISPVRSSASPRGRAVSPKLTSSSSLNRSRPASRNSPLAKSTPTSTRNVTPQGKSSKPRPVNSSRPKTVSPSRKPAPATPEEDMSGKNVIPLNFKFAQSDFAAKKNYFELSARLKAERTAAKAKENESKAKKQTPKTHPKTNNSSANPVWI